MNPDSPHASPREWTKPDFPYGRDWPDTDLWVDQDGTVRHEDGSEVEEE